MKVEIINNLDDIKKIKVIWDRLFLSLKNKSVFQTFDYNFYAYNKLIKSKINDEFKRTDLFFIPSEINISSDSKLKKFTFE